MDATLSESRWRMSVWAVGLISMIFWVIGIGCGWRGVLLLEGTTGIVGKAQAFGDAAAVWWTPGAVLTVTVAVLGAGIAIVRHVIPTTTGSDEPVDTPPD